MYFILFSLPRSFFDFNYHLFKFAKWNRLAAHHSRIEVTQVLGYGEAVMTETTSPGDTKATTEETSGIIGPDTPANAEQVA